jgi:hypothetical protein
VLHLTVKSEVGASCRSEAQAAQAANYKPVPLPNLADMGDDGEDTSSNFGSQLDDTTFQPISFAT